MGFSSVAAWVAACQETQLPMWEVILRQDLDQDTPEARAASLKQMKHMWEVMKNSASQYQSEQRSYSGLVGGDGARYGPYKCSQYILLHPIKKRTLFFQDSPYFFSYKLICSIGIVII